MSSVAVVPLTGNNFPTWKIQCKMALMKDGLWGIVSGAEAAPPRENADRFSKFESKRDRALAIIVLSINPSLLYLIGDPKDPVDVWTRLSNHFQKNTWANRLALRRKLHSLRLNSGQPVQEHVKAMTEVFNELAVIGDAIEESDRVVYLLASLPESFDVLVTALEAHEAVPKMDVVIERLTHQEHKLKDRGTTPRNTREEAMTVHYRTGRSKGPKCHYCGKYGHIQRNCREKEKSQGPNIQSSPHSSQSRQYSKFKGKPKFVNTAVKFKSFPDESSDSDETGLIVVGDCEALINSASSLPQKSGKWIIDSGATCHICNNRDLFTEIHALKTPVTVKLGDGHLMTATAVGIVSLSIKYGRTNHKCNLHDVLYVPNFAYNILSVSKAAEKGISMKFCESSCVIRKPNHKTLAVAPHIGGLYELDTLQFKVHSVTHLSREDIWHRRYGHLSRKNLRKLATEALVEGFDYSTTSEIQFCDSCLEGKQHKSPYPRQSQRMSTEPLQLIHSDVCGKINEKSLSGGEYFLTFTNDYSRYVWIYILKHKSEVFSKFCEWKASVERTYDKRLKALRTDNGGEFTSGEFEEFLKKDGIRHELTVPKNPQQNGVAERLNRTLMEMVRCMLSWSRLPQRYWAEAVSTAVYLRNRCPTKCVSGMTPYEALTGVKPKVNHLRVFGCAAYCHIPKDERKKLDVKSRKCVFMGYAENRKGYRLYDLANQKVVYSRDVTFNESTTGLDGRHDDTSICLPQVRIEIESSEGEEADSSDTSNGERSPTEEDTTFDGTSEVRRSTRNRRSPDRFGAWIHFADQTDQPSSVEEALSGPNKGKWKKAMEAEYHSLISNNVWDLVELPKDCRVINSKWIFKQKIGASGLVERYKARLVAQGYSQVPGIDYEDTFSPVARFESVRAVIALAVQKDLKLHQMDVTTAFLNGKLKEDVYMKQPEGFIENGKEGLICKLKRSIYGLKQAPRCWNAVLDSKLKQMGFKQTTGDPCLYTSTEGEPFIIAVYVDDILLAGKSEERIKEVKGNLTQSFNMKDMGMLDYFLGVKIIQDVRDGKIWLGQTSYSKSLLEAFGMTDAKTVQTPVNPGVKLSKATDESKRVDTEKYQSAVGKLLYLAIRTRPDLAYAVCNVAKYASDPTEDHWVAVKHIFRYLAGTIEYGLVYAKDSLVECCGYSDADWAGDADDRKSTSGYVFQVGNGSVSWKCNKQTCVALSTAEAEYMALSSAAQEAIWMSQLLSELQREPVKCVTIYEDNQSAICLSKNPQFHGRSKHIAIKYHFIRDNVKNGTVDIEYCRSEDMIADIMTKGVYGERFKKLRRLIGVQKMIERNEK